MVNRISKKMNLKTLVGFLVLATTVSIAGPLAPKKVIVPHEAGRGETTTPKDGTTTHNGEATPADRVSTDGTTNLDAPGAVKGETEFVVLKKGDINPAIKSALDGTSFFGGRKDADLRIAVESVLNKMSQNKESAALLKELSKVDNAEKLRVFLSDLTAAVEINRAAGLVTQVGGKVQSTTLDTLPKWAAEMATMTLAVKGSDFKSTGVGRMKNYRADLLSTLSDVEKTKAAVKERLAVIARQPSSVKLDAEKAHLTEFLKNPKAVDDGVAKSITEHMLSKAVEKGELAIAPENMFQAGCCVRGCI